MTGSGFILYKTNFFRQVLENPDTNSVFMDISFTCLGINIALMIYLALYLPYIAGVEEDWEKYCPKVIPVMTFSGLICFMR
jgi:hypothetical protein